MVRIETRFPLPDGTHLHHDICAGWFDVEDVMAWLDANGHGIRSHFVGTCYSRVETTTGFMVYQNGYVHRIVEGDGE